MILTYYCKKIFNPIRFLFFILKNRFQVFFGTLCAILNGPKFFLLKELGGIVRITASARLWSLKFDLDRVSYKLYKQTLKLIKKCSTHSVLTVYF